tara:strand:- start:268 stop:720 length:453 start_codon:yes stop_codon:yes gene_type:complete
MSTSFQALVVRQAEEKQYSRKIETRSIDDLPEGEVLVRVHYSSLNYKDGLSCIGAKGVTREYPHTPGIDAAGIVESSSSDEFKSGDSVIVTSYDLGMNTSGGFGQFIRVPSRLGGAFARRDDVEREHGLRNRRIHRRTFRKCTPAPGFDS